MTSDERRAIPKRVLVQRVRRALRKDGDRLMANRRPSIYFPANVGAYFIVDGINIMADHDVDLVTLGRELGVLRRDERVEDATMTG